MCSLRLGDRKLAGEQEEPGQLLWCLCCFACRGAQGFGGFGMLQHRRGKGNLLFFFCAVLLITSCFLADAVCVDWRFIPPENQVHEPRQFDRISVV